jgi:large subunit ribosomal protein L4
LKDFDQMATKSLKKKTAESGAISYPVVDMKGKEIGTIDLDPAVFGLKVDESLVHETVRWQRARKRAGTHQALTRTMKEGGAKKPWTQKGTGRARAGSSISPLWVGGASIHGPLPRCYDYRLSKRSRRQALAAVLSAKVASKGLVVLSDLEIKSGKTRDVAAMLGSVGAGEKSSLLMVPQSAESVRRSARNVKDLSMLPVEGVNVYDVLAHEFLIATKAEIAALQSRIKQDSTEAK